jgi:hypothetical protein
MSCDHILSGKSVMRVGGNADSLSFIGPGNSDQHGHAIEVGLVQVR